MLFSEDIDVRFFKTAKGGFVEWEDFGLFSSYDIHRQVESKLQRNLTLKPLDNFVTMFITDLFSKS